MPSRKSEPPARNDVQSWVKLSESTHSRNGSEVGFTMHGEFSVRERMDMQVPERATPFKVINVICRFNSSSGGPPRTVSAIAKAGQGIWDAELFTTDYMERKADSLLIADFRGHVNLLPRTTQTMVGGILMAAGLWSVFRTQLVRGIQPHVVHLHGVWSPFLSAFARTARLNGIPYIVAPHGMLEPWPLMVRRRRKSFALQTYQGRILREAAAIHATSEGEAENLKRLGLTQVPIFVIPNAIDAPLRAKGVERKHNAGRNVLLFLSRIHPKKGLDLLLHAWSHLNPSNWELLIVGHGDSSYIEALKRMCSQGKIANVEFLSHVDGDAREATFARATAFVLPTYSENFGNVVGEAMIRGLPVITTTGTPWSVVAERNLGWYVEPTIESLQGALAKLFAAEAGALAAMGDRGRDYVKRHLLIDAVRPQLLKMYQASMLRAAVGRS
jgi:glycosyltransferase involved in cell wall biosynthesis